MQKERFTRSDFDCCRHMPDPFHPAAFVLAGGKSSRMGQDKALLAFSGRPLVAHALSILVEAGLSARIAGADPEARTSLSAYASVIDDAQPGLGPLAGICAAFASTGARHAVFLPVDLPLLPASLISYLLRSARLTGRSVTVASINGFPQTFPAVLDRALLSFLQNELHAGRLGCFAAFQAGAASLDQRVHVARVELLVQSGQIEHPHGLPPARWFLNVNTPDELERARKQIPCSIA